MKILHGNISLSIPYIPLSYHVYAIMLLFFRWKQWILVPRIVCIGSFHITKKQSNNKEEQNVLSTVVNTRVAHTKTSESGAATDARNVHRPLSHWFFPWTQAMHHLQHCFSRCCLSHMLQRHWQLPLLEQLWCNQVRWWLNMIFIF